MAGLSRGGVGTQPTRVHAAGRGPEATRRFRAGSNRYRQAYSEAAGGGPAVAKGSAKLLDPKTLQGVTGSQLKGNLVDKSEQAEAVRSYLKSNGGVMDITVVDIPSINPNILKAGERKERLLKFNCGLVVVKAPRFVGVQFLNVDFDQPRPGWSREFGPSHSALDTTGFKKAPAPEGVSRASSNLTCQGQFL